VNLDPKELVGLTPQQMVERVHREAARCNPHPDIPFTSHHPRSIPVAELPEADPNEPGGREWNTYRREVSRLLAEGHASRFALIHDETVIGIYDTWDEGYEAGLKRYLMQPFLVQPIRAEEPCLRGPSRLWRS
jgi:hypothetical protein